jgi:glycosyltransferase involved in cell wall biosynthesis
MVVEAVECVRRQTESRFELIVVDDGSTDGTGSALARVGAEEPRLRVVRQQNGGTASARNHGLDLARAPWTAFLDSDDLWEPTFLEQQLAFARERPEADLVICDARFEGPWGRDSPTVFTRPAWRTPDTMDAMLAGAWALPSTMLLRTSVGTSVRFSTEYRHSEDTEFLFRFLSAGHRLVQNPAVLAAWCRHAGSAGAPQKIEQRDAMDLEHLQMLQTWSVRGSAPRRVRCRIARQRALIYVRAGRWREARRDLWTWWRMRPDSTRALRYLLASLLAGRTTPPPRTVEEHAS